MFGPDLPPALRQQLHPPLNRRYKVATLLVLFLLVVTLTPTLIASDLQAVKQMIFLDSYIIITGASVVGAFPLIRAWRPEAEKGLRESHSNWSEAMDRLEAGEEIGPEDVGYQETAVLINRELDIPTERFEEGPLIGLEMGYQEWPQTGKIALDGEVLDDDFTLLDLAYIGEKYKKVSQKTIEGGRESRESHFDLLAVYLSILAGLVAISGQIIAIVELFQ